MKTIPWWLYAMLDALCAAAVGIFAKFGMKGVDSDVATAVRSVLQATVVIAFVIVLGTWDKVGQLSAKSLASLAASGTMGALSWIFMFRAYQLAPVSKVNPIDKLSMPISIVLAVLLLGERPTALNWLGIVTIVVGVYLATTR